MVKVAIAGGSGVVGRTLDDEFAKQSKHEAVVFTRQTTVNDLPSPSIVVDYTDTVALTHILEDNAIKVVISTFDITPTSLSISQANLISAAEASTTVKRFIPTSFAIKYPRDGVAILPPLQHFFDSLDQLKKTHLEWATVNNGIFLDYFMPPDRRGHFDPSATLVLDIRSNKAAIPGTGSERITFSYTRDVARFVIAALDLHQWPEDNEFNVVGDTMTFNEFLEVLEESKAVKFDVVYDGMEKLERFVVTELPGHQDQYGTFPKEKLLPLLSIFERWMAEGRCKIARERSLIDMFPGIKALGIEETVEKYWKQA